MFIDELAYNKEYIKADSIEAYCELEGLEPVYLHASLRDSLLKRLFSNNH